MNALTPNSARERMTFDDGSLRSLVVKWLWPTQAAPARVTLFGRTALGRTRCVRVEASRPEGLIAFLFFRHIDGTWQVFPPQNRRPMMRVY